MTGLEGTEGKLFQFCIECTVWYAEKRSALFLPTRPRCAMARVETLGRSEKLAERIEMLTQVGRTDIADSPIAVFGMSRWLGYCG